MMLRLYSSCTIYESESISNIIPSYSAAIQALRKLVVGHVPTVGVLFYFKNKRQSLSSRERAFAVDDDDECVGVLIPAGRLRTFRQLMLEKARMSCCWGDNNSLLYFFIEFVVERLLQGYGTLHLYCTNCTSCVDYYVGINGVIVTSTRKSSRKHGPPHPKMRYSKNPYHAGNHLLSRRYHCWVKSSSALTRFFHDNFGPTLLLSTFSIVGSFVSSNK